MGGRSGLRPMVAWILTSVRHVPASGASAAWPAPGIPLCTQAGGPGGCAKAGSARVPAAATSARVLRIAVIASPLTDSKVGGILHRGHRAFHDGSSQMLSHSSDGQVIPPDPLSEVLQDLRLSGVSYGRCELAHPWGISFPDQSAARFHFIGSGEAWLRIAGMEWTRLQTGDVALLPRGT